MPVSKFTFKERQLICTVCRTPSKHLLWDNDPLPACSVCNIPLDYAANHSEHAHSVIGDEIDETIEHGLCWADGTPRRFTSRAEKMRVMQEKGLVEFVRHRPFNNDSDKSPYTIRWDAPPIISEEERLANWYETADPALAAVARSYAKNHRN